MTMLYNLTQILAFSKLFSTTKNQKEKQNLNIHCVPILDKQKQRQTHV